jgi:hypothetical protein
LLDELILLEVRQLTLNRAPGEFERGGELVHRHRPDVSAM